MITNLESREQEHSQQHHSQLEKLDSNRHLAHRCWSRFVIQQLATEDYSLGASADWLLLECESLQQASYHTIAIEALSSHGVRSARKARLNDMLL